MVLTRGHGEPYPHILVYLMPVLFLVEPLSCSEENLKFKFHIFQELSGTAAPDTWTLWDIPELQSPYCRLSPLPENHIKYERAFPRRNARGAEFVSSFLVDEFLLHIQCCEVLYWGFFLKTEAMQHASYVAKRWLLPRNCSVDICFMCIAWGHG